MKFLYFSFSAFYRVMWLVIFPLVYIYFVIRSIKEPGYAKDFSERLVLYKSKFRNAVWIHAVSLGEFRAARPIIRKLLKVNQRILITTLT